MALWSFYAVFDMNRDTEDRAAGKMEMDEQGSQVTAAGAVPDSGADVEEDDAGCGHLVEAGTKEVKVVSLAMIALQLYGFDEAICYEVVLPAYAEESLHAHAHAPQRTPRVHTLTHLSIFAMEQRGESASCCWS